MIFSEQKVAHMAAFFLASAEGPLPHLTLIKLLYLADRESMARFDVPHVGRSSCFHAPWACPFLDARPHQRGVCALRFGALGFLRWWITRSVWSMTWRIGTIWMS